MIGMEFGLHYISEVVEIKMLENNEQLSNESIFLIINQIDAFKTILSQRNATVIKELWSSNEAMRRLLCGEDVDFGNRDNPDFYRLTLSTIIDVFEAALVSHKLPIIQSMWSNNIALQETLANEKDFAIAKRFLKKVLASSTDGKNSFIKDYVSHIYDVNFLNKIQEEIILDCEFNQFFSTYKKNQIMVLKDRLEKLQAQNIVEFNEMPFQEINNQEKSPVESANLVTQPEKSALYNQDREPVSIHLTPDITLSLDLNYYQELSNQAFGEFFPDVMVESVNTQDIVLQPQDMPSTNFKEVLNQFRLALSTCSLHEIIALLGEHSELYNYVTGNQFYVYSISELTELLTCLHLALSTRCLYLKDICWQNLILQDYISGAQIKTRDSISCLPLRGCLYYFNIALSAASWHISRVIWEKNPSLKYYLAGKTIECPSGSAQIYALSASEQEDTLFRLLNYLHRTSKIKNFIREYLSYFDDIDFLIKARDKYYGEEIGKNNLLNQRIVFLIENLIESSAKMDLGQEDVANQGGFLEETQAVLNKEIIGYDDIKSNKDPLFSITREDDDVQSLSLPPEPDSNSSFNATAFASFRSYCQEGSNFINRKLSDGPKIRLANDQTPEEIAYR